MTIELLKSLQRLIRPPGNAPHAVITDSLDDQVERDIKKHHGTVGLEVFHGSITVDRAAACTDHLVPDIQLQQYLLLNAAQVFVTILVYNSLQGTASVLLNEQIGVDKPEAQPFGQQHAHGALAAAGHTDENEVACVGRVSHDAFELPLQRVRTGQQYAERNIFPTERALYSAGQARIIQPKAVLENN